MLNIKEIENKIINDDCLNILKQLPDKCIDLVLTDPPYGIGYDSACEKYNGKLIGTAKAIRNTYRATNWDNATPTKEYFDEMIRVSKNQIIFGGNYFTDKLLVSKCWLVWDKHINGAWADCELAWTNFNKPIKKYDFLWNGMLQQNMSNKEIRIHPTQKPKGLFEMILQDWSNENDLVLDCFSGSGTTAIACSEMKRRFICIEKDAEYWKKSVQRLDDYNKQLRLF